MAYPRTRVARLSITHNGEPIGIVQGTYSSYFGFGITLRVMRGPLVAGGTKENRQLVSSLLKGLEEYCKKKRIIHARILVPDSWQLQEVFHKLDYNSVDRTNEYVVNLEEGIEKLWKSIDHNKRRNIRRAMKEGVEIVQSHDQKDLETFYSMVEASVERRGFSPYPRSWFEAIWKTHKPELSKVFLAYWKGKSVSGVFIVVRGKTVYALGAGSLAEGWEVRPNDIMHWKVMEWAYQNGYSRYHMGLVDEPLPTEESSAWGIWRWKKEWKGSLEGIQAFDKIFLPKYKLILQAQKLVGHWL
jgi:lipid II:glycine glycyltransferase (peptidoglycan interpeptide bridge formation enzyme)